VDFAQVLRRRRVVRSFLDEPVPQPLVDTVLEAALRAPSAGFTQGVEWVVLDEPPVVARFWELTTTPEWRERSRRFDGLRRAPVVLLPMCSPLPYLERYREPDKAGSGLEHEGAWPVPYWLVDAAFAAMLALLAAVDVGLGAAFLGVFRGEQPLLAELGVPSGWRPVGAILLGWPAPQDPPSRSLQRGRRRLEAVVHRGRW
jgi:nitroreductase